MPGKALFLISLIYLVTTLFHILARKRASSGSEKTPESLGYQLFKEEQLEKNPKIKVVEIKQLWGSCTHAERNVSFFVFIYS